MTAFISLFCKDDGIILPFSCSDVSRLPWTTGAARGVDCREAGGKGGAGESFWEQEQAQHVHPSFRHRSLGGNVRGKGAAG